MKKTLYILSLLAGAALSSCEHKELCYDHAHAGFVRVVFDWTGCPGVAPEGMRVLFYPTDGGVRITEDIAGCTGGFVDVPPGQYDVICFNNDTEAVSWRGESSPATLEVYTGASAIDGGMAYGAAPPQAGDPNEVIRRPPDPLWGCRQNGVRVLSGNGVENVITLSPGQVTRHVTWEMSEVTNSENITMVRAALSGISGSYFMGTAAPCQERSAFAFDGTVAPDDAKRLNGRFEFFGCPTDSECRHLLTIYCWSPYGNVMKSFDVTEQLHGATDPYNIHLVIDGLIEIPAGGEDDGFDPDVDGWDDQQEDIIM